MQAESFDSLRSLFFHLIALSSSWEALFLSRSTLVGNHLTPDCQEHARDRTSQRFTADDPFWRIKISILSSRFFKTARVGEKTFHKMLEVGSPVKVLIVFAVI